MEKKIFIIFIINIIMFVSLTGCITDSHPTQFVGRWQVTEQGNTSSPCSFVLKSDGTCDSSNCSVDWNGATWKVEDNKLVQDFGAGHVYKYNYSFSDENQTLTLGGDMVFKKIGLN